MQNSPNSAPVNSNKSWYLSESPSITERFIASMLSQFFIENHQIINALSNHHEYRALHSCLSTQAMERVQQDPRIGQTIYKWHERQCFRRGVPGTTCGTFIRNIENDEKPFDGNIETVRGALFQPEFGQAMKTLEQRLTHHSPFQKK